MFKYGAIAVFETNKGSAKQTKKKRTARKAARKKK